MRVKTSAVLHTIAGNTARELLKRGVPHFFCAILAASLLLSRSAIAHAWGGTPYHRLAGVLDTTLKIAGYFSFLLSANLYESEVNRRTLMSVMAHAVDPWMHLCGRLLGMVFWYAALCVAALVTGLILAAGFHIGVDLDLAGIIAQHLTTGAMWIIVGGTLGALTSQWKAVAIMCVLLPLNAYVENVPTVPRWLHDAVYFTSAVGSSQNAHWPSLSVFDALRAADNLLYATVVFIIGASILERKDIPTRGA